jgi:hypothetical protein
MLAEGQQCWKRLAGAPWSAWDAQSKLRNDIVLRSLREAEDNVLRREAIKWAQALEKEAKKRLADNSLVRCQ